MGPPVVNGRPVAVEGQFEGGWGANVTAVGG